MRKITLLFIASLIAICSTAVAQNYEVPKDYILKAKEDYPKYEQDVINTVDWLQQTQWGQQPEKQKEANAFLLAWISGSPNVNISIGTSLMKLVKKNDQLLITFMGGYAKYALLHKDKPDNNAANAAALRAMIDKYQREPDHVKDKEMEKLIQMDKDGKLDTWAATDFAKG